MKANRNKAVYWATATGNRPKGRLKKVTMEQFTQWAKNWDTFENAPDFYRLLPGGRIIKSMSGREFRRLYFAVYHKFGSPASLLQPVETLYYDETD